jgi:hypothetical protein
MTRHEMLRVSLAALFGSVTAMTMAQTVAPTQNDVDAGRESDLTAAPVTGDFARNDPEISTAASGNVLDDVPRDMSGKRAYTTCPGDFVTDQMPAGCRRWSEIADAL